MNKTKLIKQQKASDAQSGISTEEENIPELTEEEKEAADTKINHKVIGIAVTPGGRYIGDVYSNNKVIDETGIVVGNMGENGEITDNEGNTVGSLQEQKSEDPKILIQDGGSRLQAELRLIPGITETK